MTHHPAAPLSAPDAAVQQAEDAQYYRRVLHALIDMGADLARAVHEQATAAPEADPAEASAAFERVARTVRRTILLARRVAEPVQAGAGAGDGRVLARKRIIRAVEDAIQRNADADDAERLEAEFAERLDSAELEHELDHRLVDEIITDICRDLGLADIPGVHPWKRRSPAEVAALCALAAEPGRAGASNVTSMARGRAGSDPPGAARFR